MKQNCKYNIGLDIGTTSVGWAVVESCTQKVIRKGDKYLWGVRLFEEAETAADRRQARSVRRRYERRRNRIKFLRKEFENEIFKVDPDFYKKLDETFYHKDDKINKTINISKEEKRMSDEYNKKYKTIYHLRNKLIMNPEKEDIRLVYLAIHHIIKYRGNFLYPTNFSVNNLNLKEKIIEVFNTIINLCPNLNIPSDYSEYFDINLLAEAMLDDSKNDRKVHINNILNGSDKNFINEFIKMVNGSKFNFTKMISFQDEDIKVELSFNGSDFDDKYSEYEKSLGNKIEVLDILKQLYDSIFLKRLFKGSENTNISSLMVEKYNIHGEDLKFLKSLLKANHDVFKKIFKGEKCLYKTYVNNSISYDDFIKEIVKFIPDNVDSIILNRIENGDFLPRITDKDNGKYPYQLNKDELVKIIENQGEYYPFLLDKVGDTYKIVKILEFKIPYYVGPLAKESKSDFAWLIRNDESVNITPYNFDDVVNKDKTAEKFITRMISHCTYLLDEPAMPGDSILYSKYKVMNELKQIRVNGVKLTKEMQLKIIDEFFKKNSSNLTDKKFKEYLYTLKDFDMYGTDIQVTGYSADDKFANNMASYVDFFGEEGIFKGTQYDEENADEIIEWATIFSDKDILKKRVRDNYPDISEDGVKCILSKKYSGWSSLSKKLLTEKYYIDKESNVKKSILDLMEETDENFMQIINNDEYKFQKMIDQYNHIDVNKKINYSLVENLAASPSTKRGIYQALRIVKELTDYIGYDPEAIMIEMARNDDKKERKVDRKKYLINLYNKYKDEVYNYNILMNQLNDQDEISTKLFLYFIQEGKSLYSGRPLNIEDLDSYEIDHIIPRTLIKDDSIDNKALVYREENQIKAANFTLPREYLTNLNKAWWNHLKKCGLISAKKFHNLIRKEYKDEDIEGFINRQLVETRQITKHVANILSNYYENSKIIYLNANFSHNYREKFELFKFRDINNYHHAHDAYLAAVLGEYKDKFFRKQINYDMVKELNNILKEKKDFKNLRYGYVVNSLDSSLNEILKEIVIPKFDETTGEVLFNADEFNKQVEKTLYRNDIMISRKTEIRTGEFYNQTKSKKGGNGVSIKDNMPTILYGSYTSLNPSYAVLVKYSKNNKVDQRLIGMPIYVLEKSKNKPDYKELYIRNLLNLSDSDSLEIIDKKIPFYSLLNWNDQICYLVGASDKVEVCNGKEFNFNKTFLETHKHSLNKLFNSKKINIDPIKYEKDLEEVIIYIVNKMDNEYLLYKNLISELKDMIHFEDLSLLSLDEKEKTIIELLHLLKCDSKCANFKFLDSKYSMAYGRKHHKIIRNATINNKSFTGIKESKNFTDNLGVENEF